MTLLPPLAFTNLEQSKAEGLEGLTQMGTLGTKLASLLFLSESMSVSYGETLPTFLSKRPILQLRKIYAMWPLGFVMKGHSVAYSLEFSKHGILLKVSPAVRVKNDRHRHALLLSSSVLRLGQTLVSEKHWYSVVFPLCLPRY